VLERGRDVRLLVVGEGHYRSYQLQQEKLERETQRLGLEDRIQFVGKKPLSELVSLMQNSAVLVLPSRAESLGMVLVEALACGTPVVSTRCGGPEDIVTDDVGVLVAPDDPVELAAALEDVLDNRERYDRNVLRSHALEKFGAAPIATKIAAVYERVLNGASR
jgi:glycosyltransferase involved in cell wall biosynthesis